MKRSLLAAASALLLLGACSGGGLSSLNPFGWFGASRSVEPVGLQPGQDNRALVDQVSELAVERFPYGAVVRATGVPQTQGWWDAELVPENDGRPVDGVLRLRFVVAEPSGPRPQGTPMSRELTAGYYVSNYRLAGIRQVVVTGARNALTSGR